MKKIFLLFLFILAGCSHTPKYLYNVGEQKVYKASCGGAMGDITSCYEQVSMVCQNGYDTIEKYDATSVQNPSINLTNNINIDSNVYGEYDPVSNNGGGLQPFFDGYNKYKRYLIFKCK